MQLDTHDPVESVACNICGCPDFEEMNGRVKVRCASCRSLERTRMLFFYLEMLDLGPKHKILHIAPERGIFRYLQEKIGSENYICADIDPPRYKFAGDVEHIDLCDMSKWPDNYFDIVLHSHVLEHTPCNIAYSIFHIHRMLRPSGKHIFIVPIRYGHFAENLGEITDEERTEAFGQADHVRLFGRLDLKKHLAAILRLPESFDATVDIGEEKLRKANVPEKFWRGLHGATVFQLSKADYLLGQFES